MNIFARHRAEVVRKARAAENDRELSKLHVDMAKLQLDVIELEFAVDNIEDIIFKALA